MLQLLLSSFYTSHELRTLETGFESKALTFFCNNDFIDLLATKAYTKILNS